MVGGRRALFAMRSQRACCLVVVPPNSSLQVNTHTCTIYIMHVHVVKQTLIGSHETYMNAMIPV